jgi:hypothetical protein
MKRILFAAATLVLLLSACGPQATPTIDPAQVQASAVAAANTMVALTQAAIPTATFTPPPSPTPLPSPTPIALPTLNTSGFPTASLPTVPPSGGSDTCNQPLDVKEAGPLSKFRIYNQTTGTVNISLYMSKNAFGQCGYMSVSGITKNSSATIAAPMGCWSAYAWSTGKTNITVSGYLGCINNSDIWNIFVKPDSVVLKSP